MNTASQAAKWVASEIPGITKAQQDAIERVLSDGVEREYNGWRNHATWCVHLWLTNGEGLCKAATAVARRGADHDGAQALKQFVEQMNPVADDASLWSDMMSGYLDDVSWLDVAKALRDK